MTAEEWIERCAKRYRERAGLDERSAREAAETCHDEATRNGDDGLSPEDWADEDMWCWTDDGD